MNKEKFISYVLFGNDYRRLMCGVTKYMTKIFLVILSKYLPIVVAMMTYLHIVNALKWPSNFIYCQTYVGFTSFLPLLWTQAQTSLKMEIRLIASESG